MREQIDQQASKLDDIENRLRRNNIRMVGLPKQCEGANPIRFLEEWLRETFGESAFSPLFGIERAHRVPFRALKDGHPRPLLMKLLNYNNKVTLLQKAREKGEFFYKGSRISLYPDFSPELSKRRAEFTPIKRNLLKSNITYALLYPARLWIMTPNGPQLFDSPRKVAQWLEEYKLHTEHKDG